MLMLTTNRIIFHPLEKTITVPLNVALTVVSLYQVLSVFDALQFQINTTTNMKYHKLTPSIKNYIFSQNYGRTERISEYSKSRSLTNFFDTILYIG